MEDRCSALQMSFSKRFRVSTGRQCPNSRSAIIRCSCLLTTRIFSDSVSVKGSILAKYALILARRAEVSCLDWCLVYKYTPRYL